MNDYSVSINFYRHHRTLRKDPSKNTKRRHFPYNEKLHASSEDVQSSKYLLCPDSSRINGVAPGWEQVCVGLRTARDKSGSFRKSVDFVRQNTWMPKVVRIVIDSRIKLKMRGRGYHAGRFAANSLAKWRKLLLMVAVEKY